MKMIINCPQCKRQSFPKWVKAFAMWPFRIRCKYCGTGVRLKIPHWQNLLVQILGQVVFWGAFLVGLSMGIRSAIAGVIIGGFAAILIAMIPGVFADLEVVPKKGP